jgi:hypothetical protein
MMTDTNRNISEADFDITIPVKIGYAALNDFLKQKLVGEIISKENEEGEKSNYAQILDITIEKSDNPEYDLCLPVTVQTLTSLFKNKQVKFLFYASLHLDRELQKIELANYEIDGQNNNWLVNQALETVVNKWLYAKLKEKMNFNFMPQLEEQMNSLNNKLENKIEAKEGINLIGFLEDLEVAQFKADENDLWISMRLKANGVVEIDKIKLP